MDQKQQILHYYRVDGMSLREISRRLDLDRKTVTRIVKAYERAIHTSPEDGLDDFLAIRPKYSPRALPPKLWSVM